VRLRRIVQDVVGCVVHGPGAAIKRRGRTDDYDLTVGNDGPYRLGGPARISLHTRMLLRGSHHPSEPEPWEVVIVGYQYTLLDADQREIVAFHLHPEGPSHVISPHLHLGAGAGRLRGDLGAAHIPTGTVTLAAVARLATEGLAARPVRPTWNSILRRADTALTEA
jgi:hypothetical protein